MLLRDPGAARAWSPGRLTAPLIAPTVRGMARRAIRGLGQGFIAGETIEDALQRGARDPDLALCSFDMLGEGARTDADAERYLRGYQAAITTLAAQSGRSLEARAGHVNRK